MATKRTGAAHTRVLGSNEFIGGFHKLVDAFISRSHWEVYTDFLQLAMDAFISDHTPEHPREKHYMEIIGNYKGKEPGYFSNMFQYVMTYMQSEKKDCLSEIWEEYAANAHLGQFFTPWNLCSLMAEKQMGGIDWEQYTPDRKCGISDPSCGGGRIFVAAIKKVPENKMDSVFFHGVDIDGNVCNCAALNMLLFNANSYIVHGNALSLEVWHVYRTIHSAFGGSIVEITDKEEMKRIITMGFNSKGVQNEAITQPHSTAVEKTQKPTTAVESPDKEAHEQGFLFI